ncbi:hypothetical protein [Pedobacter mendelii]|uniref:Uncharacterized protein n=1 Tax=Pedobacter mendelii TaxID=1908240 RepID=A0ABQ2BLK6_9SPHI|nr:hypothetical protein [Pedobacter mendelii]GGI29054.1 hypothetical protein GCM10008119_35720 [Pedobacter mendelii]
MKTITNKIDNWILKYGRYEPGIRNTIDANNIWAYDTAPCFAFKSDFKAFLQSAKTHEIAGLKMLFDSMANDRLVVVEVFDNEGEPKFFGIEEGRGRYLRSYRLPYLESLEKIIDFYLYGCNQVKIDFKKFYKLTFK